ncbi:hypothetical protein [Defluviimonas denitrificans]|jgi:hypothetical protein|uniref:hypothetical protein n=1 Tax=Albidovulum denitrificans TaxID=404881 RepID=UPI000CFB44CF|nr:hypothetical protein [Defluviimonas denitrificans]
MAQDEFEARLARIRSQERPAPASTRPAATPVGRGWGRAIWGGFASAVVVTLFANIQAISDAAPDAIRNSSMPGAMGAPIALLSIAWFGIIPILFTRSVLRSARAMRGFELPGPFLTGAFIALAAGILTLKVWN